jgi:hypothetical protein
MPDEFQIKIDMKEVERAALRVGGAVDQIPYVMSNVLNTAAFLTRGSLVKETWPQHVTQRRSNFPSAVLRVDKATKQNLEVTIKQISGPSLKLHAEGGTKTPFKAKSLAIPNKQWVKRTATGVRKDMTPQAIIASTPKRALRVTSRGIFVAVHGRFLMRYVFKRSIKQPQDVPFYTDFASNMRWAVNQLFEPAMDAAMRTRR